MSHDPSRKQFFAKLLGLVATIGVVPKLLAKATASSVTAPAAASDSAIQIRPAPHTVARRPDAV